jgi:hypothetical protein
MSFLEPKRKAEVKQPSIDVVLRSYISQGIKTLYFDRKQLFYQENRDFKKLSETYTYISQQIYAMVEKKPRVMIPERGHYSYEIMTGEMASDISDFLSFLLVSPPIGFRLRPRVRKYAIIGSMKVPSLNHLLLSLLTFKIPEYWRDKIDVYYCAGMAILRLVSRDTTNEKALEILSKVRMHSEDEKEKIDDFYRKFSQWIRLGLIA